MILTFMGLLASGWYGIPLIPRYLTDGSTNILDEIFTLLSGLGAIWGIMAYREFTRSVDRVAEARLAARRLDSMMGEYEYRSYNPITRTYDEGFVPSGPVDFWDKETQVPEWMDKGKYWHVLMLLQTGNREIKLQVVKDEDLPLHSGPRNVAVTRRQRAKVPDKNAKWQYIVQVPQWLVMSTERSRFAGIDVPVSELSAMISDLNQKIVDASEEVASWERLRIKYPWKFMTFFLYLNKSLPLRIVYGQVVRNFPGAKERAVDDTNESLANTKDEELLAALMELARQKDVLPARMDMIELLTRFLRNAYTRQGLGEGASEYHSFHHSLEVCYLALHMLPREIDKHVFGPKEYELTLVAGLLHDYDPAQATNSSARSIQRGPSVVRTIDEIERTRILDAYFTMSPAEFANYFREFSSAFSPPSDYSTTHPEQVKADRSPIDTAIVEAMIWRTDFPFPKQKLANQMFEKLLAELENSGVDKDSVSIMAHTLWLADLAVTYMGSDPVRAWDRVTNLYEELNLPKLEAVPRTDAFFGDFADDPLFRQLINAKNFPAIFRQRWNRIYRFFHEGNPSTELNRTIKNARKMYSAVTLEIGMRRGELLRAIAVERWSEYFIGIGRDQGEVFRAKSIFSELDPQNASAFWGDTERMLSSTADRSIDNFLLVLPEHAAPGPSTEAWSSFRGTFVVVARKLANGGTFQILTDIQGHGLDELDGIASQSGFVRTNRKSHFPENWRDPEFKSDVIPKVLVFELRQ